MVQALEQAKVEMNKKIIQTPFWITDEVELDILKKVVEWLTIARDYVKDSLKSTVNTGARLEPMKVEGENISSLLMVLRTGPYGMAGQEWSTKSADFHSNSINSPHQGF